MPTSRRSFAGSTRGAKPGDLKKLPPKPEYPASWAIGTPDAIVAMPEDFTVPASGTVEYQYFEVPTNFTEDKWVQAIEIMPGAREVVHHVLVYAKVPPAPGAARIDAGAATGWYARAAAASHSQPCARPADRTRRVSTRCTHRRGSSARSSAPTAPGTNVVEFPKGTALRLRAGTVLTFQMHYTAHGHEMKDRTQGRLPLREADARRSRSSRRSS